MQMKFGGEQVLAHRVLPDGSGVGITFKSGEDEIELLLPTGAIHQTFEVLGDILVALHNIQTGTPTDRVNARFPKTMRVATSAETSPPSVVLVFDAGLPTQCAYAVAMGPARRMSKELRAKAREAENLAGKIASVHTIQSLAATKEENR